MASHIEALTAEAQQREQAQQAAIREQARAFARQAREAFQAEWERERPREIEPAPTHEPDPHWLRWIEAVEAQQPLAPESKPPEQEQPEQKQEPQEDAGPKRNRSQDWGLEM